MFRHVKLVNTQIEFYKFAKPTFYHYCKKTLKIALSQKATPK